MFDSADLPDELGFCPSVEGLSLQRSVEQENHRRKPNSALAMAFVFGMEEQQSEWSVGTGSDQKTPVSIELELRLTTYDFKKCNNLNNPKFFPKIFFSCGAIILNEQWALTSGFCVFDLESKTPLKPEEIDIGYGSNDLVEIVHQKKLVDVDQIVPHPNFNLTPEANLALLKLKTPFNFDGEIVSPACLEMDHPRKFYTEQLFGFGFGVTDVFLNSMNTAYLYGNNSRFLKESLLQDQSGKLDLCYDKDLDETICLKGEGKCK